MLITNTTRSGANYQTARRDGSAMPIALLCYADNLLIVPLERATLNARITDNTFVANSLLARKRSVALLARILTYWRILLSGLNALRYCSTSHNKLLWCNPTELETDPDYTLRWLQDSNLLHPAEAETIQQASINVTELRRRLEASNGWRASETLLLVPCVCTFLIALFWLSTLCTLTSKTRI